MQFCINIYVSSQHTETILKKLFPKAMQLRRTLALLNRKMAAAIVRRPSDSPVNLATKSDQLTCQ